MTSPDCVAPGSPGVRPAGALRAIGLRLVLMAGPIGLLVVSMTERWCH